MLGVDPLDSARASAAALGVETASNFEDALANPRVEAVILSTPQERHAEQIVAAAKAGRHVFCEKPLCTTAADAEAAIAAVNKAGVQLGIGHERRFEPAVIEMRKRFAAGEFGNPLLVEGNFSQDLFLKLPPDNWRLSKTINPAGPLSATGIHMVDLSIALLGRPTSVWARLGQLGSHFENGDTLSITIGFENGATALLGRRAGDTVHGTAGVAGIEGLDGNPRPQPSPESTGWDVTRVHRDAEPVKPSSARIRRCAPTSRPLAAPRSGEAPYPVTKDEMLSNVRSFEAIQRSVKSGRIENI